MTSFGDGQRFALTLPETTSTPSYDGYPAWLRAALKRAVATYLEKFGPLPGS